MKKKKRNLNAFGSFYSFSPATPEKDMERFNNSVNDSQSGDSNSNQSGDSVACCESLDKIKFVTTKEILDYEEEYYEEEYLKDIKIFKAVGKKLNLDYDKIIVFNTNDMIYDPYIKESINDNKYKLKYYIVNNIKLCRELAYGNILYLYFKTKKDATSYINLINGE